MALPVSENPPETFPDPALFSCEDFYQVWNVILTRSRMEKELARQFLASETPYYLPYVRSRTPGTTNRVYVPLFPGTIFASVQRKRPWNPQTNPLLQEPAFSPEEAASNLLDLCRKSKCVYKILTTTQQRRLRYELGLIASETADSRTLRNEPCPQDPGYPVRFQQGTLFEGFEGRLLPKNCDEPKARLLVQMHLMGTQVSIQVNEDELEPC